MRLPMQSVCGRLIVDVQQPAEGASGTFTWENDAAWHELDRGVSYCVVVQARDGGGSLRTASMVVPVPMQRLRAPLTR